jgi:DNA-binding transcriptional LysR family regulator
MRLEQLHYLVVVAQCGSINKAAEKLFVTQPAISSAIKMLEDELQVKLLLRTRTGVVPTVHGERVIADIEKLFGIMNSWNELANACAERAVIVIDFSGPSSDLPLFNLYFKMKELYPHIEIRLNFYNKPMLDMDSDCAIIHACSANRLGELLTNGRKTYKVYRLYEDKYSIFVPPESPLAKKSGIKLEDLRNNTIATRSKPSTFPYHTLLQELSCKMLYLGDENIVFEAATRGYAIALLPTVQAKNNVLVKAQRLLCKDVVDVNFPFFHYLLSPTERILTADERLTYNYLKLHYDELLV